MSEPEQRTLAGYKSKIHEGTDFENPNEGKPPLNDNDEYILRLVAFPRVKTFQQIKEKRDGTKMTINVDKAICDFETENHTIVTAFFRVDSLNFTDDESFQSGIVKFFRKIGLPLQEGVEPKWEEKFVVGMRFRARVAIGKGADKKPDNRFYLDVPTCRKLLPSDVGGEPSPSLEKPAALLANALFLAKGSKTRQEAFDKLKAMNADKDVTLAFFQADFDGKITYPI